MNSGRGAVNSRKEKSYNCKIGDEESVIDYHLTIIYQEMRDKLKIS